MTGDFDAFDHYEPARRDDSGDDASEQVQREPMQAVPADSGESSPASPASPLDVTGESATWSAPITGHPRVDAATVSLDQLDDLPTAAHADVFDEVHRRLQGALSDLDGD
jgi:hypothetical protein